MGGRILAAAGSASHLLPTTRSGFDYTRYQPVFFSSLSGKSTAEESTTRILGFSPDMLSVKISSCLNFRIWLLDFSSAKVLGAG
jgi:hypothetical protein